MTYLFVGNAIPRWCGSPPSAIAGSLSWLSQLLKLVSGCPGCRPPTSAGLKQKSKLTVVGRFANSGSLPLPVPLPDAAPASDDGPALLGATHLPPLVLPTHVAEPR